MSSAMARSLFWASRGALMANLSLRSLRSRLGECSGVTPEGERGLVSRLLTPVGSEVRRVGRHGDGDPRRRVRRLARRLSAATTAVAGRVGRERLTRARLSECAGMSLERGSKAADFNP